MEKYEVEEKNNTIRSLAIMLRHFGIEKEEDEKLFHPQILKQKLLACGAMNDQGDLNLREIDRHYSLDYSGSLPYSREGLKRVWETGQPFLITVAAQGEGKYFIVPDHITEEDMLVIDPWSGKKYLREYDQVCEIHVFWKNNEGMTYCME